VLIDSDWTFVEDRATGECRATNDARGLRTRWKLAKGEKSAHAWAQHDIVKGRLLVRQPDGTWRDDLKDWQ
jgi:hypothetical protein